MLWVQLFSLDSKQRYTYLNLNGFNILIRVNLYPLNYIYFTASICISQCGSNTLCTGTLTNTTIFSCACQSGYSSPTNNGKSCSPINNCITNNGGCNQTCIYAGPSLNNCSCNFGYKSAGASCLAVNTCSVENGGCSQFCNYIGPGLFQCSCNSGYTSSGASCFSINNCEMANGNCSHNCAFTGPGTSSCYCNTGYSSYGYSCAPINSCVISNGGFSKY